MAVSAAGTLKVEVAFGSDPDSATPVWTDISAYVRDGISITRGRTDEQTTIAPGRASLSLDNTDGRFTAGRAASPYWPNVLPRKRVRITQTVGSPTYVFDGHIEAWPTSWPTGGQSFCVADIVATDLLQSFGHGRELGSVIHETIMQSSPRGYWHLDERDGASSAGSAIPGGSPLVPQQVGAGGEIKWGSGTGPSTDAAGAVEFAPVDSNDGLLLSGRVAPLGGTGLEAVALEAIISTSVPGRVIATLRDGIGMTVLRLEVAAGGQAVATYSWYWGVGPSGPVGRTMTAISSSSIADGRTHVLTATLDAAGATVRVYVDGALAGTGSLGGGWVAGQGTFTQVTVGGSQTSLFEGTVSHVSATAALSVGDIAAHAAAALTGFAGERTDQRVARVCAWAGFPAARQLLSVGVGTVGHIDSTGMAPLDYLRRVEAAEQGLIYADQQGRLVMRPRSDQWTAVAPALTVAAEDALDPGAAVVTDLQGVANDVTVTRGSGVGARRQDAASIATYGVIRASVDAPVATDADAGYTAEWLLGRMATPAPRWPTLTLDGYTAQTPTIAAAVRALDLGSRVTVTGLPSQAPASSVDVTVLGYTATLGLGAWDVACNVTAYGRQLALIADDPTGVTRADGPGVATY